MATLIIKPKNREEWLIEREKGIGSSEVGTILGINKWETPYQLWRRKVGIDPPKESSFAMRAGHYLEDAVSQMWEYETGREVIKSSAGDWLFVNSEHQHRRVSPDRTFWLPGATRNTRDWKQKGLLECKTTRIPIDPEDLPKTWFCQLQYQLGTSEMEQGALAWLVMGSEFDQRDFAFDPEFYGWMIEEVDRFWVDNIKGGKEPDPINAEDVAIKFFRHEEGKVIAATETHLKAYEELKELKEKLKELDSRKAELEDTLKMGFGNAEMMEYAGRKLATWKAPKDSVKFNEKAFKAEHPDLWKDFARSITPGRRFLLK
jgi:putative phage-type endonuclease